MSSTLKIERQLLQQFPDAQLDRTGSGHIKMRTQGVTVFVASTPSDERRLMNNVRCDVKRKLARKR